MFTSRSYTFPETGYTPKSSLKERMTPKHPPVLKFECDPRVVRTKLPKIDEPSLVGIRGEIVPDLHPFQTVTDDCQRKGNKRTKLKRRVLPFVRKVSDHLSAAFSEVDLTKILEFTLVDAVDGKIPAPPCCSIDKEDTYSTHKENCLRQAESLDNVFDKCDEEKVINGLGSSCHLSGSIAKSLPHINRLSDYEDEAEPGQRNSFVRNNGYANSSEAGLTPKISQSKRISNNNANNKKKKKTNLRRRHATREKDGRSKSLTQIDHLVGSASDMLLQGSQEGDGAHRGDEKSGGSGSHSKGVFSDDHSSRRLPLAVENRVSGAELITLVIDVGREQYEEVAVATRGVSVREVLESRGFDLASVDIFHEGVRAPLPVQTDSSQLAGRSIHVRVRDESARSPVRQRSSQIPRKPSGSRFWGGASNEDYCPLADERINGSQSYQEGSLKASKSAKPNNRWYLFQSNSKDSKMEDLVRQLDFYSRNGIPKLPHLLPYQSLTEEDELKLEDGWRSIVTLSPQLGEREEQQQSAIWELVETEATYIGMLKVITDLFLACLCNLQNEGILNEIDTEKLFNNIPDIYQASLCFWKEYLYPVLEETRKTRRPLDPSLLLNGFCKFEEIFEPYTQYCLEQTNCQLYCKEHSRENTYFKAYLAWCETQKECNRLKLVDILVQPMQRITRYSILLKAILKKTDDITHKTCIQDMIQHVDRFVSTVNTALRDRHEQERLREITKKIDAYDAVEARDDELASALRHHSDLNLLQPMPGCPPSTQRWLLHRGEFRLKDAHTSKSDVHVFLFTDFLLITKITQRKTEKVKVVRPPYRVDHLVVVELKDASTVGLIHLTDWGVAAGAFTLQSGDPKGYRTFVDALALAKKQFQDARHARSRPHPALEGEDDGGGGPLPPLPRSPRLGSSSRASRVSSLVHSHSGSVDLEGSSYTSPGGAHPPSVDLSEIRGSSASSDDSYSGHQAEIQRSKSLEAQHSNPAKHDRRLAFPRTPNTLSVTPPYTTGQSLPNLTSETPNSLRVPTSKLSPSSRGTSYPPPSPRTLRRCPPVPQSRNPPLMKTKHVTSVVGGQPQEGWVTPEPDISLKAEADQDELLRKRLSRVERLDNRRYHTAGAIDDIKKQDTKDTSIHKRLSWNSGQGASPSPRDAEEGHRFLAKHKSTAKSVSNESVHSSSGVSSTSSLLRAEYEALENIDDNELEEDEDSTVVDLSVSECTSLKLSPHISTTYICHDSDITLGVGASQYITQPVDDSYETLERGDQPGVKIDVSETVDPSSISSVQIMGCMKFSQ